MTLSNEMLCFIVFMLGVIWLVEFFVIFVVQQKRWPDMVESLLIAATGFFPVGMMLIDPTAPALGYTTIVMAVGGAALSIATLSAKTWRRGLCFVLYTIAPLVIRSMADVPRLTTM